MAELLGQIFTSILIFGVVLLIYMIIILINFLLAKGLPKDTVIAFTGGLGQGKSLITVNLAIKKLKRYRLLWALGYLNQEEIPQLYANIPIRIKNSVVLRALVKRKWLTLFSILLYLVSIVSFTRSIYVALDFVPASIMTIILLSFISLVFSFIWTFLSIGSEVQKEEFSIRLKYEHITFIERLNEYNVTVIDEIGQVASQWEFDNPFVMIYLQEFVRYYRHVYDGTLIYNDQSSENVVKPIRVRTNKIYNLIDFHRSWIFFFKVTVVELLIGEDIQTTYSNQDDQPPYYFGHLPFKWFKFLDITKWLPFTYKKFESRVHKPLYAHVQHANKEEWPNDTLYNELKYVIEIPQNQTLKKKYQAEGYVSMEYMLKFIEDQTQIRQRVKQLNPNAELVEIDYYQIDRLIKKSDSITKEIDWLNKLSKRDPEEYTHGQFEKDRERLMVDLRETNKQIVGLIQSDVPTPFET